VIRGLLWLIGGTVVFWGLVTYPARLLAEHNQWERPELTILWSETAALLCLVPTALTLIWTRWAYKAQPEQQLLAVFGGTTVRMAVVIAVGLVLFLSVKEFEYQRFWIFVIVYYLFTLALEMVLIVRGAAVGQAQPKN
jgi:Mitochondrial pyruvate carriers